MRLGPSVQENANIEMKLLLESFHIPAYLHGVICY